MDFCMLYWSAYKAAILFSQQKYCGVGVQPFWLVWSLLTPFALVTSAPAAHPHQSQC